jgi:glycyl-tRNA synthetase beta chain
MSKRDILLEIGTEEIPARFMPAALKSIKEITEKALDEARISHGELVSHATPRRLAVIVSDASDMQADEVREVFGPPKQAAYAPDGSLTKAALGFARSQGIDPEKLEVKPKEGKGEYLCGVVEDKGKAVVEILPDLLKNVVLAMHYPKSMRWGDGTMKYARPIHWVVALFGDEIITFDLEGITSGNKSRGHRFLAPDEFEVSIDKYESSLVERKVFVSRQKRIEIIEKQSAALAKEMGGVAMYDEELLSIVACILEYPQAVRGGFDTLYLELPDELLTSVMVGHQKYFPIGDEQGKLKNGFIIVSNTEADNADTVRKGAERVCKARFDDARFYFDDDRKSKLEARLEGLKKVTFQEKLGSVHDKSLRIKALAENIAKRLCPDQIKDAARAAELAKCDLITGVVSEFPELQGIMGMYYARLDGEGEAVAIAIREQYLPAFSGDVLPTSDMGAVVSLADKIDNLVSFFSIGLKPTGSEDPFALRRQALGAVAILQERGSDVSLAELLKDAPCEQSVRDEVAEFFKLRFENLLLANGHAHDIVQAVLPHATDAPIAELYKRIEALEKFKSHEKYSEFLQGFKRVCNIIPDGFVVGASVKTSLFSEEAEKGLYASYENVKQSVQSKAKESEYSGAIDELVSLTDDINQYFDKVLVMDKDETIKSNRLSMLSGISVTASYIVDFSRLEE